MTVIREFNLGTVELEINTDSGRIDALWLNGGNKIELTVEELLIEMIGGQYNFSNLLNPAETFQPQYDSLEEANYEK